MSRPEDVASQIRSATEREHLGHANQLLQFGIARAELGDWREADRFLDESATAFWAANSPLGKEGAAAATIRRATVAISEGRFRDALWIMERLIDKFDGFPEFPTVFSEMLAPGLDVWLWLLQTTDDDQRLYDAAGVAVSRLDPPNSQMERLIMGKSLVRRARTGGALGHTDGAVEMYEKAIAYLEAEDTTELGADFTLETDGFLAEARVNVAMLLAQRGRDEEANIAFTRLIASYADSSDPRLQGIVAAARMWLEAQEED